ncbi:hypothetical protein ONZ45_g8049 [Pleurotus djamor]|nr:hypothetical protein ONZ45_g8049 [Pleurotus djamor]
MRPSVRMRPDKGHAATRLPVELLERILGYVDDKSTLSDLASTSGPFMKKLISRILYNELCISLPFTGAGMLDAKATRLELTKDSGYAALYEFHDSHCSTVLEGSGWKNTPHDFSSSFKHVFPVQSHSPRLGLSNSLSLHRLRRDALPALYTLDARQEVFSNIIEGRNVVNLRTSVLEDPSTPTPGLKAAFLRLSSLSCSAWWSDEAFEFVGLCSNLKYLRMCDIYLEDISYFMDSLKSTKLAYLCLLSRDRRDEETLISGLFDAIPPLMTIDAVADDEHGYMS